MTDRFNERCISAYGHPDVKMPVIDSMMERLLNRMIASTQPCVVSNAESEFISPALRWHAWLQNHRK